MPKKLLMKGNEAMAEGAIIAGCRNYFGYPITPQNEVPEYMSWRLPEVGGVFLQAESEVASINMVFGASAAGARVMTTTSSPGYSLMQEGVSYMAGARLPCVIANVQRGGPGLGNIAASQADYFQAVKGGGHGDYRLIVLAPNSPQEMMDLTILAFELSDKYRTPALLLSDGIVGQMMETVTVRDDYTPKIPEKKWALVGAKGRERNIVRSLFLDDLGLENNNIELQKTYAEISAHEIRYEEYLTEDAEVIAVAYGSMARMVKSAVDTARAQGKKAGLFRPISLWPFPSEKIAQLAGKGKKIFLTVEMSAGQMVEDVKLAVNGKATVDFIGRMGGKFPEEEKVLAKLLSLFQDKE